MTTVLKMSLFTIVYALCLSASAFAQGETKQQEKEPTTRREVQLEKVIVTATKTPIKVHEVPATVNIVTSEDIQLTPRDGNFYDALRNTPGIEITESSSMGWPSMKIRGQTPSVLINGRDSRQFATGYTLDSALVGIGAVERIEVLKGPQSATYGGKATSGTINIITKKGDKNKPYLKLKTLYGTSGEINAGASLGGGYENLTYFVNLYGSSQDDWETPRGNIPYVEREQTNIYTHLGYELSKDHRLSLEYMLNESSYMTGGKGYYHPKVTNFNKKIWHIDPAKLHTLYLNYEGDISDWFSLYATVGGGENNISYTYGYNGSSPAHPLTDFTSGANKSSMKNNFFQSEVRGTISLLEDDKLRIITGLQYKKSELDWVAQKNHVPSYSIVESETYVAPFVQMELKPIEHVLLLAGVRKDFYSYDKSDSKTSTNPKFGVSVFPFAHTEYNWTTLWGSYTEAFNPPTAMQMQGPAFLGSNPSLKPEEVKGWEVGVKQRFNNWANIELSYFVNDYKNLIQFITVPAWKMVNVGKAKYKGYEMLAEVYPTDWLTLHFGYSSLERKDLTTGKELTGQPNNTLQYGLSVNKLYGFSGSIWGRQYTDYKNSSGHQASIGKYHPANNKIIWDMKVLYSWDVSDSVTLEPFVSVQNLTDETYYEGPYPMLAEGRTWQGGISMNYKF